MLAVGRGVFQSLSQRGHLTDPALSLVSLDRRQRQASAAFCVSFWSDLYQTPVQSAGQTPDHQTPHPPLHHVPSSHSAPSLSSAAGEREREREAEDELLGQMFTDL